MPLGSEYLPLFERIKASRDAGRMAHAYLVVGPPNGAGLEFARELIQMVLCRAEPSLRPCHQCRDCHSFESGNHPDMHQLEPCGKSRVIKINPVREMINLLALKSFSGGWKAALILHADRLNPNAANCFLKTLEEPPANTLLVLVTESPQALLPTVRSRCQRILLPRLRIRPQGDWVAPLTDMLRKGWPRSPMGAVFYADHCAQHLGVERKRIEKVVKKELGSEVDDDDVLDARVSGELKAVRKAFLNHIQNWQRDVLLCASGATDPAGLYFPEELDALTAEAARLGRIGALEAVKAVDQMDALLAGNLGESVVLTRCFLS